MSSRGSLGAVQYTPTYLAVCLAMYPRASEWVAGGLASQPPPELSATAVASVLSLAHPLICLLSTAMLSAYLS